MQNLFLLKLEIIIFLISFVSIIFLLFDRILGYYLKIKKYFVFENNWKKSNTRNFNHSILPLEYKKKGFVIENKNLTFDEINNLEEILKKVKIHSFKWSFDTVKYLIIEWLTIDKFNKDLNLELANLYEKEDNYKKAYYIYNDLRIIYPLDIHILKKQAFATAMINDFEKSFKLYEEIFKKQKFDLEIIWMLSDLAYKLKKYKKSLKYTSLFLNENPRDIDKILIKWDCLEKNWTRNEALKFYKQSCDLHPYNPFLKEKISILSS